MEQGEPRSYVRTVRCERGLSLPQSGQGVLMIDHATVTGTPEATDGPRLASLGEAAPSQAPEAIGIPADDPVAALQQRVLQLEEKIERLQDTQPLETRVAERVLEQVKAERPAPSPARDTTAIMLGVGRQVLPAALGVLQGQAVAAEATASARQPWLIVDLYADLRTLVRMARDPLYRTVWLGRALTPLALLGAILTSWLWLYLVPGFALLPDFLAKLFVIFVDLFLAFILCKALQREIRRYREAVPDQSPRNDRALSEPTAARKGG